MALSDNLLGQAGQIRQNRMSQLGQMRQSAQNAGEASMMSAQQFQQQLKVVDYQAVRQRASLNAVKFAKQEQDELRGQAITWGAANPDVPLDMIPAHLAPVIEDAFNAQRVTRGEKKVEDIAKEKASALADEDAAMALLKGRLPAEVPAEEIAQMPFKVQKWILTQKGTQGRFDTGVANKDAAAKAEEDAFNALDTANTPEELNALGPLPPKASEARQRRINAFKVNEDRAANSARADQAFQFGRNAKDRTTRSQAFSEAMRVITASQKGYMKWSMAGSVFDEAAWARGNPGLAKTFADLKNEVAKEGVTLSPETPVPVPAAPSRMRELLKKGDARTPEEDAEFLDLSGGR